VKIGGMYSHLNGHEWLLVHQKQVWGEIEAIIGSVDADKYKTKISQEKRMKGRNLYAPKELNKALADKFEKVGWKQSRTSYWVTDDYNLIRKTLALPEAEQKQLIESGGKKPIYSYNQTDFVKNRIAVEVQFGKYSFVAYSIAPPERRSARKCFRCLDGTHYRIFGCGEAAV
jgi:hypothetical protein